MKRVTVLVRDDEVPIVVLVIKEALRERGDAEVSVSPVDSSEEGSTEHPHREAGKLAAGNWD